jgi:hypothetical protein
VMTAEETAEAGKMSMARILMDNGELEAAHGADDVTAKLVAALGESGLVKQQVRAKPEAMEAAVHAVVAKFSGAARAVGKATNDQCWSTEELKVLFGLERRLTAEAKALQDIHDVHHLAMVRKFVEMGKSATEAHVMSVKLMRDGAKWAGRGQAAPPTMFHGGAFDVLAELFTAPKLP